MYGEIFWQLIRECQSDFPRKLQHSVGMLKVTKRISNVHFSLASSVHAWSRLTVISIDCFLVILENSSKFMSIYSLPNATNIREAERSPSSFAVL